MTTHTTALKAVAAIAGVTLIIAACGSVGTDPVADGPAGTQAPATTLADDTTTSTSVPPTSGPDGGWIDGEPDWRGGADGSIAAESEAAYDDAATSGERIETGLIEAPSDLEPVAPIDIDLKPVDPDGGIGDGAEPLPVEPFPPAPEPVDETPLRAGSVDDNADYQGFLDYIERIESLGITLRDFDPSGRIILTVTGSNGLPVSGVDVTATIGDASVSLRTTADGTVRFLPAYVGASDGEASVEFSVAGTTTTATAGADVEVTIDEPGGADAPVPLDILFLLDATGSMGDEIDRLKATIDTVAERVAQLDPAPDVRFAMTLYRDVGDLFVTANYDFTADVDQFRSALAEVIADGGGDYPEALDEGLADALAKPSWRDPADAVQLIFVVADAPPQVGRQVAVPYTESIAEAASRGIKIFPVASSESDDQAEAVFRQMAQATGAPFVFLSNGADGASIGGSSDIQSTDYEELALDELVVRLIAEELGDLNGSGAVTVPTTIAPPTTNPEGQ